MAAAPFPPLYQIQAPPDRHITSFECFFFFFGDFAFNCSPVYNEEQEVSFGRSPTVIPFFMTVTLCCHRTLVHRDQAALSAFRQ